MYIFPHVFWLVTANECNVSYGNASYSYLIGLGIFEGFNKNVLAYLLTSFIILQ